MNPNDEQARTAIAAQAAGWFVTNDDRPLDEAESAALVAWLKASPVHVEEFLGVSVVARDLGKACDDAAFAVDALLERARADDDSRVPGFWSRLRAPLERQSAHRWQPAAAIGVVAVLALAAVMSWKLWPISRTTATATVLHFQTGHGE